jgi:hypothetical protein
MLCLSAQPKHQWHDPVPTPRVRSKHPPSHKYSTFVNILIAGGGGWQSLHAVMPVNDANTYGTLVVYLECVVNANDLMAEHLSTAHAHGLLLTNSPCQIPPLTLQSSSTRRGSHFKRFGQPRTARAVLGRLVYVATMQSSIKPHWDVVTDLLCPNFPAAGQLRPHSGQHPHPTANHQPAGP